MSGAPQEGRGRQKDKTKNHPSPLPVRRRLGRPAARWPPRPHKTSADVDEVMEPLSSRDAPNAGGWALKELAAKLVVE